ncbi:TetR/AcrR family transcriptional regulator [Paenibacillus sambharensis]|uniref:TetR/AcrR family transcriptional regulator n=1 Tax=Paenibacillus sambharensis TaxID=1803190 RepID=A0A2W1LRQ2_9BACL|nr:TetR/AcrR family transcriptional regulator [Paenibacillus sambharensis]PZD97164.1 TetR/AcrR family transcriptional regulator [Paenibacillus sambharensis]
MVQDSDISNETRMRILDVTTQLLAASTTGEISNRAICEAAGVKPPTLYHYFGDKDGLVQTVVNEAFERYLESKRKVGRTGDLITDFRRGWDMHVEFGVGNPALYDLMYGRPLIRNMSPAVSTARSELLKFMSEFEAAGRLRLPIQLATDVVESAAIGVTLQLIRTNSADSDPLVFITREAVMAAVIGPDSPYGSHPASPEIAAAAARLRDELPRGQVSTLRASETSLLHDWLDILAGGTNTIR